MRIFIAEDEPPARERLVETLARVAPQAVVVGHADTVQATAAWLAREPAPDVLMLDIQLADGLSLELFDGRELEVPVIFTTAYDRFALDAFRALAVDYLLKPIADEPLAAALAKVARLRRHFGADVGELLQQLRPGPARWRQRLLGRLGGQFHSLAVADVACFVSVDKLTFAVLPDGRRYQVETPLADLQDELDPAQFFRANRQVLIAAHAVQRFAAAGKGRLRVEASALAIGELTVSPDRAAAFRAWLGG
ncbi:LytR/AlgR family response regulator transcription factor [Scleromatobacter humisilvae]|uniref:LytTR family DNA-binding domain-containing protein n=1 Tax=Scleromatobacter humisilvae TaxID=2897159 RepID=A0A9X2C0I7_9BURK|nr:LytTR family DNA-binding domain-containing protein [Scleromatobacter humisilvae]MCK9687377.1 LytTR family DNA-binding domain-containing protein [Scleromatobacter humisilvae]